MSRLTCSRRNREQFELCQTGAYHRRKTFLAFPKTECFSRSGSAVGGSDRRAVGICGVLLGVQVLVPALVLAIVFMRVSRALDCDFFFPLCVVVRIASWGSVDIRGSWAVVEGTSLCKSLMECNLFVRVVLKTVETPCGTGIVNVNASGKPYVCFRPASPNG